MSSTTAGLARPSTVSFSESLRTWTRVALLSFGGPAGQIAVMHRILVDEKRWIGEERFLHALNFCMLLPGPEAQQLATYIGWLMHGTRGGLVAGGLFVLPGLLAIMAFSIVYVTWGYHPLITGLFLGLKAAVVALIVEAILRIGRRAVRTRLALSIGPARADGARVHDDLRPEVGHRAHAGPLRRDRSGLQPGDTRPLIKI